MSLPLSDHLIGKHVAMLLCRRVDICAVLVLDLSRIPAVVAVLISRQSYGRSYGARFHHAAHSKITPRQHAAGLVEQYASANGWLYHCLVEMR